MAKLHHATLKAAVLLYAALHLSGSTEVDLKSAIAKDEKKFDEDQVNEIYEAIVNPKADDQKPPVNSKDTNKKVSYVVKQEFRDISNFDTIYRVGDEVPSFDKERLDHLLKHGLIE